VALGALAVDGETTIDSPGGFRDHTERWLSAIGLGHWVTDTRFAISGGSIPPARYEIPGDPSSAAFLWACAAIHDGSRITTRQVSLNPGRLGFLQILGSMGASVEAIVTGATGGDPVGNVTVAARPLHAVDIGGHLVASALDELPLVAVLGAFAEGVTTVSDAAELRVKESDRIASVAGMLRALGGGIETADDGFSVVGAAFLDGGTVDSAGDHRIAMAAAVAATRADDAVTIQRAEAAAVSWPDFFSVLEGLWS